MSQTPAANLTWECSQLPTAAESRAAIAAAFDTYSAELAQAGAVWEQKPEGSADGEAAWCARQVAAHIASAGIFFGAGIATACGLEAPKLERISLPDAGAASSETRRTHGLLMEVVNKVSDEHLGIEFETPQLGKQTVASMLGVVSYHLNDHANQLKTLRGG